jgi:hypothetical protein
MATGERGTCCTILVADDHRVGAMSEGFAGFGYDKLCPDLPGVW